MLPQHTPPSKHATIPPQHLMAVRLSLKVQRAIPCRIAGCLYVMMCA